MTHCEQILIVPPETKELLVLFKEWRRLDDTIYYVRKLWLTKTIYTSKLFEKAKKIGPEKKFLYQNFFFYLTNKSIDIYPKYIIFNDLELDSENKFSVNFSENENVDQIVYENN